MTPALSDPEMLVLHFVKLKHLAPAPALAAMTGLPEDEVRTLADAAVAAGLATVREGRVSGYRLTPEGAARAADLLVADVADPARTAALEEVYTAFLPLNDRLKVVTTAWQLRDGQPNDHSDAGYDAAVVDDLAAISEGIGTVLDAAADRLARLGVYSGRFHAAVQRVRAGEHAAFARPMAQSFHDAWMELHADLLASLHRERSEADGH